MDNRLQNLGFAANLSSNAFNIVGNSTQVGGAGGEFCADTVLRPNSPDSSMAYMSSSKGIKWKWSLIGESLTQHVGSSLSLGLGRSPSSSDSKGSSATACTAMSSAKETDEESSMDFELDFALHLGNEKVRSPKNPANSNLSALELQPKVDFCKAHGGGKRCPWGHPGSVYGGQATGPCNSFAKGKTGLCVLHSGLVQDKRVHGGTTLGPIVQDPKLGKSEKMKEVVIADDMNLDVMNIGGSTTCSDLKQGGHLSVGVVPEGRVHRGNLMAHLAGGSDANTNSIGGNSSGFLAK